MFSFFANLGPINKDTGLGPFAAFTSFLSATALFEKIFSNIVGFLTIAGSLWFIVQFILGAYSWMTAGGDKAALKTAQDKITRAVTGLVILVAAYALISVIGSLVGLDILNPAKTLENLMPNTREVQPNIIPNPGGSL